MDKSKIRILVLDDEPFMLKLLSAQLSELGFPSVATTVSGQDALDLVRSDAPPNLILFDLNMPSMDGLEFVRILSSLDYEGGLVLISGEDERLLQMTEKLVNSHNISLLGYLNKPPLPADLERVINKWTPSAAVHKERPAYRLEDIRAAILNYEIVNYYQPRISAKTGAVIGVEAVPRWRHQEDGMVLPEHFLEAVEQNGLLDDLAREMLIASFAHLSSWQKSGLQLLVAMGISMESLASTSFVDLIASCAKSAEINPQDVVLELTQSRSMLNSPTPMENLTRLSLKRFRLSIDDFAANNSSLIQLRSFPLTEIKVSMGFAGSVEHDDTALAMYEVTLAAARELDLDVVAASVDDLSAWKLTRQAGCAMAQGEFISGPMAAELIPTWISSWRHRIDGFMASGSS